MSLVFDLTELLSPVVEKSGFILEEVKVTPLGRRRQISIIVDGEDRNPNLDEVAGLSRAISTQLDEFSALGDSPFTLEVTSPGVDRPLTELRHWRKNIGRLVKIITKEDKEISGRIQSVGSNGVTIDEIEYELTAIKRAQIQIEFNRSNNDKSGR
jgi:ribosome maturation factor RimP